MGRTDWNFGGEYEFNVLRLLVPGTGIEPVRPFDREILSLLCLPISPPGRIEKVVLRVH